MGARNLAGVRAFVDIRRLDRVRLDAGLIDQREPSRRTGSEHEFGPADHMYCGADRRVKPLRMRAETSGTELVSQIIPSPRLLLPPTAPAAVGIEPLRAAALHAGRVERRPIFDLRRMGASQLQRLVVRGRR